MMKHGVALTQSALTALDGQKHLLLKNTSAHIIKGCGGCSIVACIYAKINSHGLFPFRGVGAASVGKLFFARHRAENTVDERRILCRSVFFAQLDSLVY